MMWCSIPIMWKLLFGTVMRLNLTTSFTLVYFVFLNFWWSVVFNRWHCFIILLLRLRLSERSGLFVLDIYLIFDFLWEVLTFEELIESLLVSSVIEISFSASSHALGKNLFIFVCHTLEQVAEQESGCSVGRWEVGIYIHCGVVEHRVGVVCYHGWALCFVMRNHGWILGLRLEILKILLFLGAVERDSVV